MENIQNKDTEIIVTKKVTVAVPDFTKTLKESLAVIAATKEAGRLCDKQIEIEEAEKGEMIKQYCVALFTPFIDNISEEDRRNFFSSDIYKSYTNTFKGCTYYTRISYNDHIRFVITFGLDRNTETQVIIYTTSTLGKGKGDASITKGHELGVKMVVEGWADYKMLLKSGLKDRIDSRVKVAVNKTEEKNESLNIIKNFNL